MPDLKLDADAVGRTVDLLSRRIDERFPGSGLSRVARELGRIAGQTQQRAQAIGRPILGLRLGVAFLIVFIAAVLATTVASLRKPKEPLEAFQFIPALEAGINDVVLVALTKDPEWIMGRGQPTAVLPPRRMSRFEVSRYLDYCREMLSTTGKIAALYIQEFDDNVALVAVNEVENLTTGLSRKIWQKLMIVHAMGPEVP
jgi:hypothetical protein